MKKGGKEIEESRISRPKCGKGGYVTAPEKGEVRNPKGKPPGTKSFKKIFKRLLSVETTVEDIMDGKVTGHKMSKREAAAFLLVRDATDPKADPNVRFRATKEIMDRVEGQAKQKIDLKSKGKPDTFVATDEQLAAILAAFQTGE